MRAAPFVLTALLLGSAQRVEGEDAPATQPAPGLSATAADEKAASSSPIAASDPMQPESSTTDAVSDTPAADPPLTPGSLGSVEQPLGAQQTREQAELTDTEFAALGLDREQHGLDTDLHFSGFMDVNYLQLFNPREAPFNTLVLGDEASLLVGHLNLYVIKNILESFRMTAEVRFLYSPNGAQTPLPNSPIGYTEIRDYSGTGGSVHWGGIAIERAYAEWSALSFLTLRLGAFLTPYGIWNVDHGSPVFIPVFRPYAVNGVFFPEHQTGIEAFGRSGLTPNIAIRYHFTLSNGFGPVSEFRDLDSNKAVGGRLALEYVGLGTLQVGGSALYGETSAGTIGQGVDATGTSVTLIKTVNDQAYITATAADVQWKYRGLHLQGEWVGQRLQYTKAGRTPLPVAGQVGIPVNAVPADLFNWAGYVLIGYRMPWLGIMPFGTLEYQRSSTWGVLSHTAFSQVGLNIRPADAIVFKVEYHFVFAGSPGTKLKVLAMQLAWAF